MIDLDKYPTEEQIQASNDIIALDTETLGRTRKTNIPCYFSWAAKDLDAGAGPTTTDEGYVAARRLALNSRPKVAHNLKFDYQRFEDLGLLLQGELHDTTLMHALLNEHHLEYHRLKALANELLGHSREDAIEMAHAWKAYKFFTHIPQEISHKYATADAEDCLALYYLFEPQLREAGLWDLYRNEVSACLAYSRIERRGVMINLEALDRALVKIDDALIGLQKNIFEAFGREFLITNPALLGDVLKEYFPLTIQTKTGNWCTAKSVLEPLRSDPRIQLILAFRFLSKAGSTLRGYKNRMSAGRVHPEYRQTTVTGRSAASDPPVQQIPKQRGRITEVEVGSTELATLCAESFRSVRRVFIPAEGAVLVASDYSQVEYRAFVHYSGSDRLIAQLCAGEDFHKLVCMMVFGHYNERLRHITKMLNYGLLYGMSEKRMVKQLAGESHPRGIIQQYERMLPEMRTTQKRICTKGRITGFVKDVFERKYRYREDIGDYILVAWLCQGTAANIKKYALTRCDALLQGTKSGIVLDIHDELVFELYPEEMHLLPEIKRQMEDFPQLDVPTPVEISIGPNLLEMEKVKDI